MRQVDLLEAACAAAYDTDHIVQCEARIEEKGGFRTQYTTFRRMPDNRVTRKKQRQSTAVTFNSRVLLSLSSSVVSFFFLAMGERLMLRFDLVAAQYNSDKRSAIDR